jgi:hypothetical protein
MEIAGDGAFPDLAFQQTTFINLHPFSRCPRPHDRGHLKPARKRTAYHWNLHRGLLVIVGAEAFYRTEITELSRRAHVVGRLSVDVAVVPPVDQISVQSRQLPSVALSNLARSAAVAEHGLHVCHEFQLFPLAVLCSLTLL